MVQGQYANTRVNGGGAYGMERDAAAKQAGFESLQRKCTDDWTKSSASKAGSSGSSSAAGSDKSAKNVWGRFQNASDFKSMHNY